VGGRARLPITGTPFHRAAQEVRRRQAKVSAAIAVRVRREPAVFLLCSLWGDNETGVTAWRKFEAAIPGSTDDLEASRVPTLFAPRYDTRAGAAYNDWVGEVQPVRERELRQRAAAIAAAAPVPTSDASSTDAVMEPVAAVDTVVAPASPPRPEQDDSCTDGTRSLLAALQANPELRDRTLQRRDAALLAVSQLSKIASLGAPMAACDGLCTGLARLVETTVGITDAPAVAAGALARIAAAPTAASVVAAALTHEGLTRLQSAAACNAVIAADVSRVCALTAPFTVTAV
jgi:hypothetical protein